MHLQQYSVLGSNIKMAPAFVVAPLLPALDLGRELLQGPELLGSRVPGSPRLQPEMLMLEFAPQSCPQGWLEEQTPADC